VAVRRRVEGVILGEQPVLASLAREGREDHGASDEDGDDAFEVGRGARVAVRVFFGRHLRH
jgi:hypothetical protein